MRGNAVRLNLHKSIFDEKHHIELNDILSEAYKKRISIHIEDEKSYQNWVVQRPRLEQEKWIMLIKASANLHNSARTTCIFQINEDIQNSDWDAKIPIAKIDDVDYLLKLPLTVALENSRNDRNFLLSLCKPSLRERLIDLEKQQCLGFVGGGGINELINNMQGKYIDHPANRHKYWVLFDGDAALPGKISETSNTLIDICKANNFDNFHCLTRRAIENYLPISDNTNIEELYSLFNVDNDEFHQQLKCFSGLTKDQRYHYHMKEGLRKDNCKSSGLYNGLDKKITKLIGRGFKVRIDSVFSCGNNAHFECFEPIHQLHLKENTPKELSAFLIQLDFNTRKTK
jgi:hypothetical protein